MVTPTHGQSETSQLVFDQAVLSDLTDERDSPSCMESVQKLLRLEGSTPPFNSLADKIYRAFTRRDDGLLRADTIQDFLQKSCTAGRLSATFHTDFPAVFVDGNSFRFGLVADQNSGLRDFSQAFPLASGLISLSRVGFDSGLDEAIVSSTFVCGLLCGERRRYILRKTRGKWVVVQSLVVWIS